MNKTLYILTNTIGKDQNEFSACVLPDQEQSSHASAHVFIQDGLTQKDKISDVMYGLQDENESIAEGNVLKSISYRDLLGLIFHSDNIVVM